MQRRLLLVAVLAAADVLTLLLFRSQPGALARHVAHPRVWLARVGADAALVTAAATVLWLAAAWLGLGLLGVAARRLPGRTGALAARICASVLPQLVLRFLAGSAGLGVLLAPVPAAAAGPPSSSTAATVPAPLPAPVWPSATPSRSAPATPVPAPRWPSTIAQAAHNPARRAGPVTVRPGDCLWLIAARRLGPHPTGADVAAQWPRWYAANRSVIGADPNLITPGEVLHAPPAHRSEARS